MGFPKYHSSYYSYLPKYARNQEGLEALAFSCVLHDGDPRPMCLVQALNRWALTGKTKVGCAVGR